MLTQEEETKLIEAAVAGSAEAFEALYRAFVATARRAVYGKISDDDVEDVVQEVFLKVHRKLDTFNFECRFATWIHRIAFTTAIDTLRTTVSQQARLTVSLDEEGETAEGEPYRTIEEPGYEDPTISNNESRELVARAVRTLEQKDQHLIGLILDGWGPTEVAAMLGEELNTVKSSMFRARQRLKDAIIIIEHQARRRPVQFELIVHTSQLDEFVNRTLAAKAEAVVLV